MNLFNIKDPISDEVEVVIYMYLIIIVYRLVSVCLYTYLINMCYSICCIRLLEYLGLTYKSRGAAALSVTVKPTSCGFNPHSRKLNIYLHL